MSWISAFCMIPTRYRPSVRNRETFHAAVRLAAVVVAVDVPARGERELVQLERVAGIVDVACFDVDQKLGGLRPANQILIRFRAQQTRIEQRCGDVITPVFGFFAVSRFRCRKWKRSK